MNNNTINNNDNTINSDLIRGHIDTIILRSLYFGDRYGYDIIKEIEQKTDGEYQLKQPTLYSCLKRLEDQGFTSSYWGAKSMGGRKKYYTLTDMGKQLFIKNQTDWQRSRQIIERLIEGEEFELSAARPRVFEKAYDEGKNPFDDGFKGGGDKEYGEKSDQAFDKEASTGAVSDEDDYEYAEVTATQHAAAHDAIHTSASDRYDNFAPATPVRSAEEESYDNFEVMYDTDPDAFREQQRYDNFSNFTPTSADPYKPAIFIPEETEDDIAARDNFEAAQRIRENTKFTQDVYELDSSGEFIREFGLATDEVDEDDTELLYLDQKDKPSYIDDVSSEEYRPAHRYEKEHEEDTIALAEDELPYAEHLLKEYGVIGYVDDGMTTKDEKADDVNELPCQPYIQPPEEVYASLTSQEQEPDVNELPYEVAAQDEDEPVEDDGVELSPSERFQPFEPFKESAKDDEKEEKDNEITKDFFKYDGSAQKEVDDEEIISRQYHSALSRLVKEQKPQPRYSPDPFVQTKLEKTAAAAAQTGDELVVRKHTDSVKQYNSENYYYSSRLRLWHYGIMFLIMLIETAVTFAVCELFVHKGTLRDIIDLYIYIIGVIVSLLLPLIAFIAARFGNLDKRKKADHDFKSLIIFRVLLCALLLLIIFLVNSYLGILTNSFSDYLARLIYPVVLVTNVVTSVFIFKGLYKSKKFQCQ